MADDLVLEGQPAAQPPIQAAPSTRGIFYVLVGILIVLAGILYFVADQALVNPIKLKQDYCVESDGQVVWSTGGGLICDQRPLQSIGESFGQNDWVIMDGASANPFGG